MAPERVITVEYLEPSMSRELLGKFPDESAFDFDYSQSGIWSPLLPRGGNSSISCPFIGARRILSDGYERMSNEKLSKVKGKIKKKKKKFFSKKSLDFSPHSTPKKGWGKVLRAAAKRFKKQRRSPLQIMLPTL